MVQVGVLRSALARLAESRLELDHALDQIKLAHSRPSGIAATDASMAVGWQKTLIEELAVQCSATSQLCHALLSASDANSSTRQRQKEAAPSTLTAEALYAPGTDDDDGGRGKVGAAAAAPKAKLPSLSDFVPSDDEEEKAEEAMRKAAEEERVRAKAREEEERRTRQREAAAKLEADAKAAADGWDKSAEGEGAVGEATAAVAVEGTPAAAESELGLDENGKRKRPPNLRDATIERMQARLKASLYGTTAKAFFKRYDKDKSGSLSAAELKDLVRRVLKVSTEYNTPTLSTE